MDTTEKVTDFVIVELLDSPPDLELEPTTPLLMDGLVSSIAAMRLIAYLEETFDISVPPEDVTLENFGTIAQISQYVSQRSG